jgi:CDP-diacylglycerol--serine O-phosphatidyltransferase
MVSRLPTLSLKKYRLPHHLVVPALLGIGLLAAFLTTAPWPTLLFVGLAYLGSIPLTMRAAARLRRTVAPSRAEGVPMALPPTLPPYPLGEGMAPSSDMRH